MRMKLFLRHLISTSIVAAIALAAIDGTVVLAAPLQTKTLQKELGAFEWLIKQGWSAAENGWSAAETEIGAIKKLIKQGWSAAERMFPRLRPAEPEAEAARLRPAKPEPEAARLRPAEPEAARLRRAEAQQEVSSLFNQAERRPMIVKCEPGSAN